MFIFQLVTKVHARARSRSFSSFTNKNNNSFGCRMFWHRHGVAQSIHCSFCSIMHSDKKERKKRRNVEKKKPNRQRVKTNSIGLNGQIAYHASLIKYAFLWLTQQILYIYMICIRISTAWFDKNILI